MSSKTGEVRTPPLWTIEEAEALIESLAGVLSARIEARPGGEVEEIHILTTEEVSAKQTVRNVESALRARFDLTLDHRKISVAQSATPPAPYPSIAARGEGGKMAVLVEGNPARFQDRILFRGHRVESEDSHRVKVIVSVGWHGESYQGLATGADLPRSRLETTAHATLRAIEGAVSSRHGEGAELPTLSLVLDGVKVVDAFDRQFALVAVHAMSGREIISLAGAASVEENLDRSVVLATLQATDRWVRGKIT